MCRGAGIDGFLSFSFSLERNSSLDKRYWSRVWMVEMSWFHWQILIDANYPVIVLLKKVKLAWFVMLYWMLAFFIFIDVCISFVDFCIQGWCKYIAKVSLWKPHGLLFTGMSRLWLSIIANLGGGIFHQNPQGWLFQSFRCQLYWCTNLILKVACKVSFWFVAHELNILFLESAVEKWWMVDLREIFILKSCDARTLVQW